MCMVSAEVEHYIGEVYRKSLLLMSCFYLIQNVNSLLLFKNKNTPTEEHTIGCIHDLETGRYSLTVTPGLTV